MPTLELPNLAAYRFQAQNTPPPIAQALSGTPIGSPAQTQTQTTCPPGCSPPGLNLCVQQGATLSSNIVLTVKDVNGVTQPVDITGNKFEFTAKTSNSLPDTDPTVIKVDWTETTTPKQGSTWLIVPSNVTATMALLPYFYQVRMVQSPTSPSPIVTPLFNGTLTVIQPVSPRY
jgi:hypothetical protein